MRDPLQLKLSKASILEEFSQNRQEFSELCVCMCAAQGNLLFVDLLFCATFFVFFSLLFSLFLACVPYFHTESSCWPRSVER